LQGGVDGLGQPPALLALGLGGLAGLRLDLAPLRRHDLVGLPPDLVQPRRVLLAQLGDLGLLLLVELDRLVGEREDVGVRVALGGLLLVGFLVVGRGRPREEGRQAEGGKATHHGSHGSTSGWTETASPSAGAARGARTILVTISTSGT